MDEKYLFNSVINKYSNDKEIEYLKQMSQSGLEDYEDIIIEDYCKPPGKALIIGCGAGREAIGAIKKNLNITGIDIVEKLARESYKKSEETIGKANFLAMNAVNLGFKENSFKYILLLGQLISLIPLRKNRVNTLKECKRVLKDKGILILTTHSREKNFKDKVKWKVINLIRKMKNSLFPGKTFETGDKWVRAISGYKLTEDKIFLHLYTQEEAIKDIKEAGLKLVKVRCATEIVNNKECPKIRNSDKYIVYVTQKI